MGRKRWPRHTLSRADAAGKITTASNSWTVSPSVYTQSYQSHTTIKSATPLLDITSKPKESVSTDLAIQTDPTTQEALENSSLSEFNTESVNNLLLSKTSFKKRHNTFHISSLPKHTEMNTKLPPTVIFENKTTLATESNSENICKLVDASVQVDPFLIDLADQTITTETLSDLVDLKRPYYDSYIYMYIDRLREITHKQVQSKDISKEASSVQNLAKDQFNHDEALWQAVSCSICLELYSAPYTLQCGHSYCFHCLQKWCKQQPETSKIKCPACRTLLNLKPHPNSIVQELVDVVIDRLPLSEREIQKERIESLRKSSKLVDTPWESLCAPSTVMDFDDLVPRCSVCTWEVVDGTCVRCGIAYYLSNDELSQDQDSYNEGVNSIDRNRMNARGSDSDSSDPIHVNSRGLNFSSDQLSVSHSSDSEVSSYDDGEGFVVDDDDMGSVQDCFDSDVESSQSDDDKASVQDTSMYDQDEPLQIDYTISQRTRRLTRIVDTDESDED
ncbi:hypothetical protein BDV3_004070 [Batrachochytrium dendrobatidis]|uniref:RING-type domain-containing protein n=1 Tax=Batrachochytrium dendrobatidis (strain JEL423) TaxID=403673 RepID=A0A177WFG3_BATDL|nr:hypothetical protein BDEG_22447 [Batrachochytrium dendrobatidis JEL423]